LLSVSAITIFLILLKKTYGIGCFTSVPWYLKRALDALIPQKYYSSNYKKVLISGVGKKF